jgi:hypothetical protein
LLIFWQINKHFDDLIYQRYVTNLLTIDATFHTDHFFSLIAAYRTADEEIATQRFCDVLWCSY